MTRIRWRVDRKEYDGTFVTWRRRRRRRAHESVLTDGRTPLPAAQTELTLKGLTTAWRSLLVEQRTKLTQVLQQTDMFSGHSHAQKVRKSPSTVCQSALVQRVYNQLKCSRVVSHVPEGECLTDSPDTGTGHDS